MRTYLDPIMPERMYCALADIGPYGVEAIGVDIPPPIIIPPFGVPAPPFTGVCVLAGRIVRSSRSAMVTPRRSGSVIPLVTLNV
jgi:hypothetical protein